MEDFGVRILKLYLKYSVFLAGAIVLIQTISSSTGCCTIPGPRICYLTLPSMILTMILAVREKRSKELGGFISFGQAFRTQMMIGVISSLIISIYVYFYTKFNMTLIQNQIVQNLTNPEMAKSMAKFGKFMPYSNFFSEEQMKQLLTETAASTEKWLTPWSMALSEFKTHVWSACIWGLFIAAFMKTVKISETARRKIGMIILIFLLLCCAGIFYVYHSF